MNTMNIGNLGAGPKTNIKDSDTKNFVADVIEASKANWFAAASIWRRLLIQALPQDVAQA